MIIFHLVTKNLQKVKVEFGRCPPSPVPGRIDQRQSGPARYGHVCQCWEIWSRGKRKKIRHMFSIHQITLTQRLSDGMVPSHHVQNRDVRKLVLRVLLAE